MEKNYNFKEAEPRIYKMWEDKKAFTPKIDNTKKPFTILLPPPNASGKMHTGNVLMIAIEDILIRWQRMKGVPALWVPGTDHAGFETQITFEKALSKEGKSRFDFDRETLYQKIWEFVYTNKGLVEGQIKRMGASVDWTRNTFTLDERVVSTVHDTFIKMASDGLVYRGEHIVNFCPKCGTTFADLEIVHEERTDPLYFVRYKLVDRQEKDPEFLIVATTRPEPIFVDTHLAVNPKDKKNAKWAGREVLNPLTSKKMQIISDGFVDPKFGTGIVKLTPAHDKTDYEVALKHKLPVISAIDWGGKVVENAPEALRGKKVSEARKLVVEELQGKGLIEKIDTGYKHTLSLCYKGNHEIEPLVVPNWFVKVDDSEKSFKGPALEAVKNGQVKIYPKWREKTYIRWMEEMRDWPISRQIVWGIRIPAWYKVSGHEAALVVSWVDKDKKQQQGPLESFIKKGVSLEEIKTGMQRLFALPSVPFVLSKEEPKDGDYLPETDTFDTWFSSGQWPLVTLGYPDSPDFEYFYPTSVLETGWEIIRLWVSRMVMFGIYLTGKPPFEAVYLHGLVRAVDGRKMSKSLGNVINPEEYIEQYGVDALRMGLISGTAGGKDFNFPKDKILAFRNFANKLWNIARFMLLMMEKYGKDVPHYDDAAMKAKLKPEDKEILKKLHITVKSVEKNLEKFRFAQAGECIYQFVWHEVADVYVEAIKDRPDQDVSLSVLRHVITVSLKILHPFMPFVTEEVWANISEKNADPLAISEWPIA